MPEVTRGDGSRPSSAPLAFAAGPAAQCCAAPVDLDPHRDDLSLARIADALAPQAVKAVRAFIPLMQ
jgi:hypothetical protein